MSNKPLITRPGTLGTFRSLGHLLRLLQLHQFGGRWSKLLGLPHQHAAFYHMGCAKLRFYQSTNYHPYMLRGFGSDISLRDPPLQARNSLET